MLFNIIATKFVETIINVESQIVVALVIGVTTIRMALMKMACSNTDETVTLVVMVQKSID